MRISSQTVIQTYQKVQRAKPLGPIKYADLKKEDPPKVSRNPEDHRGKVIDALA